MAELLGGFSPNSDILILLGNLQRPHCSTEMMVNVWVSFIIIPKSAYFNHPLSSIIIHNHPQIFHSLVNSDELPASVLGYYR